MMLLKPKCHSETFVISETCENCLSSDLKKDKPRKTSLA